MKNWLIKFIEWFYGTKLMAVPPISDRIWETTRGLVKHFGTFKGESGEWKRHQVYSKLVKLFPAHSHQDLALIIELVVRENA